MQVALFFGAAAFEIGGCYLVWLAVRTAQPWLWPLALAALGTFALLLALTDTPSAGRAFAVYGGIYIAMSIAFMVGVERVAPDRWDLIGVAVCLAGAAIIFFGPRP